LLLEKMHLIKSNNNKWAFDKIPQHLSTEGTSILCQFLQLISSFAYNLPVSFVQQKIHFFSKDHKKYISFDNEYISYAYNLPTTITTHMVTKQRKNIFLQEISVHMVIKQLKNISVSIPRSIKHLCGT
jgi:hypothetical protein